MGRSRPAAQQAIAKARAALAGNAPDWAWKLESGAGTHGAAVVPGPAGISDAFIAFSDGRRDLVFEGFAVQIDQLPLGPPQHAALCDKVAAHFRRGRGVLDHDVFVLGKTVGVRTEVWAEQGALRFAFAMPEAKRDARGTPRFTLLALGPASEAATRVYAGFGNVIENPGRFDLHANGFQLATRHVGADYAGGLALGAGQRCLPRPVLREPREEDLLAAHPPRRDDLAACPRPAARSRRRGPTARLPASSLPAAWPGSRAGCASTNGAATTPRPPADSTARHATA